MRNAHLILSRIICQTLTLLLTYVPVSKGWSAPWQSWSCVGKLTTLPNAKTGRCHGRGRSELCAVSSDIPDWDDGVRRNILTSTVAAALLGSLPSYALDDYENKRIAIFEKASPSVVFIDTFIERRDAFSTNVLEVPLGSGSGFVWDKAGHIVTNYHGMWIDYLI